MLLYVHKGCQFRTKPLYRSSHSEMLLGKGVLKICSKFTREHPCQSNFMEIALRHVCSPVNLLHIFKTPLPKNISECLPLFVVNRSINYAELTGFNYFELIYNIVGQSLLQTCAGISKWGNFITKWGRYHKVGQPLLQRVAGATLLKRWAVATKTKVTSRSRSEKLLPSSIPLNC